MKLFLSFSTEYHLRKVAALDWMSLTTKKRDASSAKSLSSLGFIDNGNIGHSFLGMHGLRLSEHGVAKVALNFVKSIKSILNYGSAKQKLKKFHSKISSF